MIKKFNDFISEGFINESLAYTCGVCGERAEHEEIEDNPNMKCSNCGHCEWEIEHDDMNEGIRDTFNKVKSRLKEYTDAPVEEPEFQTIPREIELDTEFEDRIPEEEYFELERESTYVKYDKDELDKLNLYFGVANKREYDLGKYFFSERSQIFGQPMKTFKGTIDKKKIAETKEIVYLVNMHILVKTRESSGQEWVVLKYEDLAHVFKFLDTILDK